MSFTHQQSLPCFYKFRFNLTFPVTAVYSPVILNITTYDAALLLGCRYWPGMYLPGAPRGPCIPISPMSPGGPLSPGAPGSPMSPGRQDAVSWCHTKVMTSYHSDDIVPEWWHHTTVILDQSNDIIPGKTSDQSHDIIPSRQRRIWVWSSVSWLISVYWSVPVCVISASWGRPLGPGSPIMP